MYSMEDVWKCQTRVDYWFSRVPNITARWGRPICGTKVSASGIRGRRTPEQFPALSLPAKLGAELVARPFDRNVRSCLRFIGTWPKAPLSAFDATAETESPPLRSPTAPPPH